MSEEYYADKVCVVTGGNSGIGYAVCEELLKRNAIVYMAGRNPEKVKAASEQLSHFGDKIQTVIVDVTVQEQVDKAIKSVVSKTGRLDFLFNNAGVGGTLPFKDATLEDWKIIMDTNLWSVIYGVTTAVPIMLEQGFGHIVNTSSVAGILPHPFQSLYSVTKFGVTALTECLRYEYHEKGIYFSTVCPSEVATPIFLKSIDGKTHDEARIPEDAYPVDKAAVEILDGVAKKKGIIIVPEEPVKSGWERYVLGDKETEKYFLDMAHQRRESFEKKGIYF